MRAGAGLGAALGLALWPAVAGATWSIAAVDPKTREVGVAVASCVEGPYGETLLPFVAGLAPGHGALAAQALFDATRRDDALALLLRGTAPQTVIDAVVAGDPATATRQYAVVTIDLGAAAFTGSETHAWAGHRRGRDVTVQGNILRGPAVVEHALAAFEADSPACPWTLADRLMLALEVGATQGGDARCNIEQAALAAALRVAAPGDDPDAPSLDLRVPSQAHGGAAPVALLRAKYDAWRRLHPPDPSRCLVDAARSLAHEPRAHEPRAGEPVSGCRCTTTSDPCGPLLVLLVVPFRRRAVRTTGLPSPRRRTVAPAISLTRASPRAMRPAPPPAARKRPAAGQPA